MKKQKSLTNIYFYSMTGLTVILTVVFALIWMQKEIATFNKESEMIADRYIDSQKEKIKHEVEQAIEYLEYKKSTTEQRLKDEIKGRVDEVFYTLQYIYQQNKDSKSKAEIEKLVKQTIHPMSWDDGTGYFFSFDTNAIETVNRNNAHLVGKSMWDFKDKKGKYVVREMLSLVADKNEGYIDYYWDKPSTPGKEQKKISYVKLFKPLGWVVGTGKYLDDEAKTLQKESAARLDSISLEGGRYYFAGTYDGLILTKPAAGKNMHHIRDSNGIKIVQELIKAARDGGGFVEYVMPELDGQKPLPKISYAVAVPEWNWFVGSGIYINEIGEIIAEKKSQLEKKMNDFIFRYMLIALILIVIIIALAKFVTLKINNNLESFFDFFYRSSDENTKIDEKNISFSEFHHVARYANEMLERRIKAEAAEQKNFQQYLAIFESSRDAIFLFDLKKRVYIDCNPAALAMFGIEGKDQLINIRPENIAPKFQIDGTLTSKNILQYVKQTLKIGSCGFEWRNNRLNGEEFDSYVLLTFMKIGDKQVILTTIRDITEQKRTQALMIQTEKMLSIGGLAAGMAHEINNPLAGMIQTASTLENRLLKLDKYQTNINAAKEYHIDMESLKSYMRDRGIERMVNTIKESGARIAGIVKNMLNFARSQGEQKSRQLITELVEKSLGLAVIDYNEKKHYDFKAIQIIKEYQESIPEINCEPGMIQQVILNLLQNSAYEMHNAGVDDPKITIRSWYQKDRNMVVLEIEDIGPGVSQEYKGKLFEPFFTTKAAGVGTGLGLSVSYYIISKDHGGEMSEVSEPGKGAKFRIMLPAVKE